MRTRPRFADIYHDTRSKHETLRDEAERFEGLFWHIGPDGMERRHPNGGTLRVTDEGVSLIDDSDEVMQWPR